MHAAFEAAVRQEIEVEREFSVFDRFVLDASDENAAYAVFSGHMLSRETELKNRIPLEFRVSVKVQRENRFSVLANNELVLELVKLGMVAPDVGLELMLFDGKEQAKTLMHEKIDAAEKEAAVKENSARLI